VFAIDRSILDRSSRIDIGQLCLSYSVGGHEAAGTCQLDNERAETNKSGLIARLAA
jgi:nanoRNase/pAp phosphatase (c-di-AMP/oligoRNAs hydrolase)